MLCCEGECNPGPFVTMPPQPTEKKPGQLPIENVRQYFDQVRGQQANWFKYKMSLVDSIRTKK